MKKLLSPVLIAITLIPKIMIVNVILKSLEKHHNVMIHRDNEGEQHDVLVELRIKLYSLKSKFATR